MKGLPGNDATFARLFSSFCHKQLTCALDGLCHRAMTCVLCSGGGRSWRRPAPLGEVDCRREALHLARSGILCCFGRHCAGEPGCSVHEGGAAARGECVVVLPAMPAMPVILPGNVSRLHSFRRLHYIGVLATSHISCHAPSEKPSAYHAVP